MTITQPRGVSTQRDPLVVASVPSGHVYVRHLAPVGGGGPLRLPDPLVGRPDEAAQSVWWPPVMLDAAWVDRADIDVFHLHFGFDPARPEDLARLTDTLQRRGIPLVFTVHDLRNPHQVDRRTHDELLDVLVPAADALITLTRGAADEIECRWGRLAQVVPHPHVVDLSTMARALRVRSRWTQRPFRVGVHLKSLRPNMAPDRVLPTLVETIAGLDDAVLQVNCHRDVLEPTGKRYDARLAGYLREQESRGTLELAVHDFFTDVQLGAYLVSLDVSVLPYAFGTHSGWLEACRDLQTTVVAPSCGFYAQQGPVLGYTSDEDHYDPDSLRDAIVTAHRNRPRLGASIDERAAQRGRVALAHDGLYRGLAG